MGAREGSKISKPHGHTICHSLEMPTQKMSVHPSQKLSQKLTIQMRPKSPVNVIKLIAYELYRMILTVHNQKYQFNAL